MSYTKPNTTIQRIPVKVGRRSYIVVRDSKGVIRVEYQHAVLGTQGIDMGGRTARRVLAALNLKEAMKNV